MLGDPFQITAGGKSLINVGDTYHLGGKNRDELRNILLPNSQPKGSLELSWDHVQARQKRLVRGTGEWLHDSEAFTGWLSEPNSFLWLHGIAGCGKTILSSAIIDYCQNSEESPHTARYYFNARENDKRNVCRLLRSLLLQLCPAEGALPAKVNELCGKRFFQDFSDDQLFDALECLIQSQEQTYIVIDALDECDTSIRSDDAEKLASFLLQLTKIGAPNLHLLVTSRTNRLDSVIDKELKNIMNGVHRHEIDLQKGETKSKIDGDIGKFVKLELKCWDNHKENEADIDSRGFQERTALHTASSQGHYKAAQLLLERGADIDAKDRQGRTALHIAASRGYDRVTRLLLEKGADPGARDNAGCTALDLAIRKAVMNFNFQTTRTNFGYAGFKHDHDLINTAAQITKMAVQRGNVAFSAAARITDIGVLGGNVKFSAEAQIMKIHVFGGMLHSRQRPKLQTYTSGKAISPSPRQPRSRRCVSKGEISPSQQQPKLRRWISKEGNVNFSSVAEITEIGVSRGNVAFLEAARITQICVWEGKSIREPQLANLLLGELTDNEGWGVSRTNIKRIERIEMHGGYFAFLGCGEITVIEDRGGIASFDLETAPLHLAARREDLAIVRLLLEKGADPNVRAWPDNGFLRLGDKRLTGRGWTALHEAAFKGHETIVKLLLDNKADAHIEDASGQTALEIAASQGHTAVVRLFEEEKLEEELEGRAMVQKISESVYNTFGLSRSLGGWRT
ncbi:hypothetical protein GQX73_g10010 [Xylaria multiplex]|uniref:NACHT domain-containing protein n=1 Tax=Xylaria multiplex TaxID=323545 RepID=A0A7C8N0J2_9PEZI|nr:hypothetical protein GQX73_g10010 [Xylaria multiplex]